MSIPPYQLDDLPCPSLSMEDAQQLLLSKRLGAPVTDCNRLIATPSSDDTDTRAGLVSPNTFTQSSTTGHSNTLDDTRNGDSLKALNYGMQETQKAADRKPSTEFKGRGQSPNQKLHAPVVASQDAGKPVIVTSRRPFDNNTYRRLNGLPPQPRTANLPSDATRRSGEVDSAPHMASDSTPMYAGVMTHSYSSLPSKLSSSSSMSTGSITTASSLPNLSKTDSLTVSSNSTPTSPSFKTASPRQSTSQPSLSAKPSSSAKKSSSSATSGATSATASPSSSTESAKPSTSAPRSTTSPSPSSAGNSRSGPPSENSKRKRNAKKRQRQQAHEERYSEDVENYMGFKPIGELVKFIEG